MCRCNDRRVAIIDAAKALAQGNATQVMSSAQFVVVSAVQDVASAARKMAAHRRLRRS